ncbi:Cro/Cl family transcriptional regulator [Kingella negevensis]|uniref:Uncharacterized protein n=1 Tax=Kingella negevensis TaxID=1522312 RepID=A0A238T9J0_9NEIS|nr:Cro/Cl family transcriptional regulator [Kingella negevensis]MDK4688257.1 hypothetical protein [Kingella negevensis]WII94088.1 hypothetical protein QEO94_04675 [Kingella negevensis]SNB63134.1 Uncharacterised protein [Kingella negevensis]
MNIDFSPLSNYLNSLSHDEQILFAHQCNTTIGYMRKRISLKRPFGFKIANEIAYRGIMKPQDLRPNDYFNYVWKQNHSD